MLSSLLVLAAEVDDPTDINPVVPDTIGEIFWGAVAFFSLWILMRYWLLPPLLKVREERRAKVIEDQEAAEAARMAAEGVRRDYDATIAEARAEANRILEEARAEAEEQRGAKVAAAESEVAQQRQAAMAELEAARAEAVSAMGGDVADLAVAAASKVVDADLDVGSHRSIVDSYVEESR